jgi:hypothetical protein
MRQLVGEEDRPAEPVPAPAAPPPPAPDVRQALVQAGVQFLEALAAALAPGNGNGAGGPTLVTVDAQGRPVLQVPLPAPELVQRGAAAVRALLRGLGSPGFPSSPQS